MRVKVIFQRLSKASQKKKKIKSHLFEPELGDLSLYADFISYHSPTSASYPSNAGLHGIPLTSMILHTIVKWLSTYYIQTTSKL